MVQKKHQLCRARRCELLAVLRSSGYYQATPVFESDQMLMQLIDKIHLEKPYLGSRRIVNALSEDKYKVARKRIQRLMRLMGIQAINPGLKTTRPHPQHKVYPYLLQNLDINCANQV